MINLSWRLQGLLIAALAVTLATVFVFLEYGRILAPWLLIALALSILAALVYLGFLLFHRIQMHRLERDRHAQQNKLLESQRWREEQAYLHQQELETSRLQLERERLQLEREKWLVEARHILVPAGHHVVTQDTQPYTVIEMPSARLALPSPGPIIREEEEEPAIPHAPTFAEMSHLLTKERLILCYTRDGTAPGTIDDLLSMGITGKPGKGKTTALMYYVTMLLQAGAEVFVWDPHGAMADLAVLNGRILKGMPPTAKVTYLDRKEDIMHSVPVLLKELGVRDELYRKDQQVKHPLLLLADELPVLADFDEEITTEYKAKNKRLVKDGDEEMDIPSLIKVIRKTVLEARKWRCFFIGSGQSFDAQILPTRVTENFNSRIVFFSSDRRARMSGLENDAIKNLLPTIRRAGSGVMIFDCARWDAPVIGAIPYITVADMLQFLGVPASKMPSLHLIEADHARPFEVATEPLEVVTPVKDLSEREASVLRLLLQGSSQKQIIQELYQTSGGDKYVKASAVLQQIIQKLVVR